MYLILWVPNKQAWVCVQCSFVKTVILKTLSGFLKLSCARTSIGARYSLIVFSYCTCYQHLRIQISDQCLLETSSNKVQNDPFFKRTLFKTQLLKDLLSTYSIDCMHLYFSQSTNLNSTCYFYLFTKSDHFRNIYKPNDSPGYNCHSQL